MNHDTSLIDLSSLPEHVHLELERRAIQEQKSKETVIIESLERGLGVDAAGYSDLDFLAGSWEEDAAFDEAVQLFETVDEEVWS